MKTTDPQPALEPGARRLLETEWSGPGTRPWRRFTWKQWLESLVFPSRYQRIRMTLPGTLLILLTLGVGTAAYNAANNLLFLTLALLLSCLIVSGILSWINFRDVSWRLSLKPPLRVGSSANAVITLRNANAFFPSQSLFLDLSSEQEKTATPKRHYLKQSLDPKSEAALEWTLRPERRGLARFTIRFVGSNFPFGFLRKSLVDGSTLTAPVWPAPISYSVLNSELRLQGSGSNVHAASGTNGDLRALRDYRRGDAPRDIHWKASARAHRLVVREYASEANEGVEIWIHSTASLWPRPAQFETLCRFAATLAEDLFLQGNLLAVRIDQHEPLRMRTLHDLEHVLDSLALLEPQLLAPADPAGFARPERVLTFKPEGKDRVAAWLHGTQTAIA